MEEGERKQNLKKKIKEKERENSIF